VSRLVFWIWLFLIISSLSLSIGYISNGFWQVTLIEMSFCLFFGFFERLKWRRLLSIIMLADGILVGFGLHFGIQPAWLFLGLIAEMFAWDLQNYKLWLNSFKLVDQQKNLENRHLFNLSFVLMLGVILSGAVSLFRIQFSFEISLFLGLLCVLGLSWGLNFAKQMER
jgi:hypothetical protein